MRGCPLGRVSSGRKERCWETSEVFWYNLASERRNLDLFIMLL